MSPPMGTSNEGSENSGGRTVPINIPSLGQPTADWYSDHGLSTSACDCGCGCTTCRCKTTTANTSHEASVGDNASQDHVVNADATMFDHDLSALGVSLDDEDDTFGNSFEVSPLLTRENLTRVSESHRAGNTSTELWAGARTATELNWPTHAIFQDELTEEDVFNMDPEDDPPESLYVSRDSLSELRSISYFTNSGFAPSVPSGVLVRGAGMSFPSGPLRLQ